jgi:adenosylcobinamide kinase / adenosylcobinamide-phosphate guanylyltransferase
MGKIVLVTGGQRSGKSNYAQKRVESSTSNPIYLATSRIWDDLHKQRIEKHKADRGEHWRTIEEEKFFSNHSFENTTVLIDCITLWLNNFFFDNDNDVDVSLKQAKEEIDKLKIQKSDFIVVTNEIGMGGFPINPVQAKFTDLQGWVNQYIASLAEEVIFMVSGIPFKVK